MGLDWRGISSNPKRMVTLVVATTIDPASIGPAAALLAMPGWQPGPNLQVSFTIHSLLLITSLLCGFAKIPMPLVSFSLFLASCCS